MGCSPSRGNNLATAPGPFRSDLTVHPRPKDSPGQSRSDDGETEPSSRGDHDQERSTVCSKANSKAVERKASRSEIEIQGDGAVKLRTQDISIRVPVREWQDKKQDSCEKKGAKKSKKCAKGVKPKKKDKERKCASEEKVDFPEPLVKAHQAAYAYLNPNIDKYEDLLGLLDHVAQIQITLQPMVSFMVLRCEEINKGLQQVVEDGEKLLKEHGEHLAWHSQKKNVSSSTNSTKKELSSSLSEPPPDLLQQLLQYSIQKMRLVGQSFCGLGDTALEETMEYFNSVSDILDDKLKSKRASESRLLQLLSRIEAASQKKPGPEDSALFSEDSGIGAESESLAGSDRHVERRSSCESTSTVCSRSRHSSGFTPLHHRTHRGRLFKKMGSSSSLNSLDSTNTITAKEHKDSESFTGSLSLGESEDVEDASDEEKCPTSKQSPISFPDPRHPRRIPTKRIENAQNVEMTMKLKDAISGRIHFLSSKESEMKAKQVNIPKRNSHWTEDGEKNVNRPQTAITSVSKKKTVTSRSRSADSLRNKAEDSTMVELQRTREELNHRMEKMTKVRHEKITAQTPPKQQKQTTPSTERKHFVSRNIFSPSNQRKIVHAKVDFKEKDNLRNEKEDDNKNYKVKERDMKSPSVKGSFKPTPTPSPPASPRLSSSLSNERKSVKKLIDTFSQGMMENKLLSESAIQLGPLRNVRRCGVPIIPGLRTSCTPEFNENNGQVELQCSERTDPVDIESLPPPPLEVLMDNSFENVQMKDNEENVVWKGQSILPKKEAVTQRLQTSVQTVVLPSKGAMHRGSFTRTPAGHSPQQTSDHFDSNQPCTQNEELDPLYQRPRTMMPSRRSSDSTADKTEPNQNKLHNNQGHAEMMEKSSSRSQTQASLSTTRTLPSTPLLHRRLPSPPVFQKQTYISSVNQKTSPPVARKLPTPPAVSQRNLSNTPVQDQRSRSTADTPYSFKAPTPPASPKVRRLSRENVSEDSTSKVFPNAQSVFCPVSSSLFEARLVSPHRTPQAWDSTGFSKPFWSEPGQLPMSVRGPRPYIRRSQSDRRPSLNVPPSVPVISVAEICGSEPAINRHGLDDGSRAENKLWDKSSEIRGAMRSASHPNLCIVGRAFKKE